MGRVVSKLNLNRTPELVENNSLIFAKNIKLLKDGSLGIDNRIDNITDKLRTGLLFYYNGGDPDHVVEADFDAYNIVGYIPYNTKCYIFISYQSDIVVAHKDGIIEYDEETETSKAINTGWKYSGGDDCNTIVEGIATVNLRSDILLTINEYYKIENSDTPQTLIPIKTININESSIDDDESIYTQTPYLPPLTLSLDNYYTSTIPAGVYQFFVRYEIKEGFYTNWFPASKELFAASKDSKYTTMGTVRYINNNVDSNRSFVFNVDKLKKDATHDIDYPYNNFQIGFIVSNEERVYSKIWKSFNINTSTIYFEVKEEDLVDIDIEQFTNTIYNLYNVKNVTNFKNKLYISNYRETDFNVNIQDWCAYTDFNLRYGISEVSAGETGIDTYNGYEITIDNGKITEIDNETLTSILNNGFPNLFNDITGYDSQHIPSTGEFITTYLGLKIIINRRSVRRSFGTGERFDIYKDDIIFEDNVVDPITDILVRIVSYIYKSTNLSNTYYDENNNSFHIINIKGTQAFHTYYDVEYDIKVVANPNLIKYVDYKNYFHEYSLVPGQYYSYYIHLVDKYGQVTNGQEIITSQQVPYDWSEGHDAIYPIITCSNTFDLPSPYVYFFISIVHVKNKVSELINLTDVDINDVTRQVLDSIELDTMLYNQTNELNIKHIDSENHSIFNVGYYYGSGSTKYKELFGSNGKVLLDANIADYDRHFIEFSYEAKEDNLELIKLTPYLNKYSLAYDSNNNNYYYDNYKDLNIPGYLCEVVKVNDNFTYYSDGNNLYEKIVDTDSLTVKDITSSLVPTDIVKRSVRVYSNFNLNYISLAIEPSDKIITITRTDSSDTVKKLLSLFPSTQLSNIYELKASFYNYTRKSYIPIKNTSLIEFNNTIRSSKLFGDESKQYINVFESGDYYNVPTNKGIIINLVSAANLMLVHTQDSLFKFTGYNSLTAHGGEDIQVTETDVFDSGIQEMFGSQYGFGGISNKKHQAISEEGYIWYDKDSNIIYYYGGENSFSSISEPIDKLLNIDTVEDVWFASDFINERFIIHVVYKQPIVGNRKEFTISYNVKSKSFISLHDFKFSNSFHTKTRCYFVEGTNGLYTISKNIGSASQIDISLYSNLYYTDSLYPSGENKAFVDIIYNNNYELVKVLDSIQWICNVIQAFKHNNIDYDKARVAEEYLVNLPSSGLMVYSDSARSEYIDLSTILPPSISNYYSLYGKSNNPTPQEQHRVPIDINKVNYNSFKYPRYNLGKWNFNYFRNTLDTDNKTDSDNKSLIYGKYFVVRFVFNTDDNWKFENLTFNTKPSL